MKFPPPFFLKINIINDYKWIWCSFDARQDSKTNPHFSHIQQGGRMRLKNRDKGGDGSRKVEICCSKKTLP